MAPVAPIEPPKPRTNIFKKLGKKKVVLLSCALVLLIACIVVTVGYVIPYAPHYFEGNKAFESGDYVTAIAEYEQASNFLNTKSKLSDAHYEYAEKLYSNKKYFDAASHYDKATTYDDADKKLVDCGTKLLNSKKYKDALTVFEMVDDANSVSNMKNYTSGMIKFEDGSYSESKQLFTSAEGYKDSNTMINACDLMTAEDHCKNGNFSEAKRIYASLPYGFSYNGISATGRLTLLNNSQPILNAVGTWTATDNYIETRNVYKRTGSWDSWYHGHDNVLSGQELEIKCVLNTNNTFNIEVKATFYKFDDYSSLSEYCNAEKTTKTFTIRNVTSIPTSYYVDGNTYFYYTGGAFRIEYSERDNYSSYFYNLYNSSVTYGRKA